MGRTRGAWQAIGAVGCLILAGAAARSGGLHLQHGTGRPASTPDPSVRHEPRGATKPVAQGHGHVPVAVGYVIAVLVGLALLALLLLLVRGIRRTGWRPGLASFSREPDAPATSDPADAELVAQGAVAALAALDAGDDPRTAVIAAYAGMVAALECAGTPGTAVLTPGRLLLRAAAAGLVDGDDARALTALFERARFSTQEITGADVTAARARLDAVRSRLPEPVTA